MTAQPRLFEPAPKLTSRQQHALELIQGDGATSRTVGHAVHQERGCAHCTTTSPCRYAEHAGLEVLKALRRKGLAVRRRSGFWQTPGKRAAAPDSRACKVDVDWGGFGE